MQVHQSTEDQDTTVYSQAFKHPGGPLDLEVAGTPSGATASLLKADLTDDPSVASNYRAADDTTTLTAAGTAQLSLDECFVTVQISGGDGSTALDVYLAAIPTGDIKKGLEPLFTKTVGAVPSEITPA